MISEPELEYLKNIARAATWDEHNGYVFSPENAAFIATFNPEFVLRILSAITPPKETE